MKQSFFKLLLLVLAAAIVAGCQTRPPPSPDMTQLGPDEGMGADWIDSSDVYAGGIPGLEMRDPAYVGTDAEARQMRGVLESVYFEFDRSTIRPGERAKLESAYQYLSENPNHKLLIEGHCDWRGTAEYNLALGDRRASSAKDYLVQLGLSRDRIETVSKGDMEAIVGGSESEMQRDRRAELIPIRPFE